MAKGIRNYKERRLYYFECLQCGHKNRTSLKRSKAKKRICKACQRANSKINPNQQTLFGEKEQTNA